MIKSIEIKNFKSIKKKYFPLRNLNVLLGLNGMGKSTFIQSLLTLRQSRNITDGRLDLNGPLTKIGSTKDALYQYANEEDMEFNLSLINKIPVPLKFKYQKEADYFIVKGDNIEYIRQSIYDEGLFNINFQYLNANRQEPVALHQKNFSSVLDLRNVGNRGEFTVHYIEAYSDEEILLENLLHKDSTIKDDVTGKNIVNRTLLNQINLWMGEISPGINIRTNSISSEYVRLEYDYKQPNFGFTNRYSPENVGFGISYVLPIVTTLLAARTGELIIIENPESHIHPRGQAELGRLIAMTAMNTDVQIIVETHSDHIVNGIRVAVKEHPELKDETILFYFEKTITEREQFSKITDVFVDRRGELDKYPPRMLDEWSNQLFKLM